MREAKWAKYAAFGGPVFVVLSLLWALRPGTSPSSYAKADKVAKYFSDHRGAVKSAPSWRGSPRLRSQDGSVRCGGVW